MDRKHTPSSHVPEHLRQMRITENPCSYGGEDGASGNIPTKEESYARMIAASNNPSREMPQHVLSDRRNTPVGIGSTQEQLSIPDQVDIIGSALKGIVRQATVFFAEKIQ